MNQYQMQIAEGSNFKGFVKFLAPSHESALDQARKTGRKGAVYYEYQRDCWQKIGAV